MSLAALKRKLWPETKQNDLEFKSVYQQYYSQVLAIAKSLTNTCNEAEDITQEVFIAVMKSLPRFKGESSLSTWLYRITCRISQRHMVKKRSKNKVLKGESDDSQELNENSLISATQIHQAINNLPLMHRTILSLICFAGLSHQQVAEILDVPIGTVWSRLHQARKTLADDISKLK